MPNGDVDSSSDEAAGVEETNIKRKRRERKEKA